MKTFEFLAGSLTKQKNEFESVEIEELIDFYRENEPLWNHHLKEYRDRNLREVKLRELMEQFEGQFAIAKIKQQWHNLLTNYKREKQREEISKSSGFRSSEIYTSSSACYHSMLFTDNTIEMDESQNSLSPFGIHESSMK